MNSPSFEHLRKAAKVSLQPDVLAGLENLRIIGRCECRCDSVDFAEHEPEGPSRPIADGTGKTPARGDVGILIWGTDDALIALTTRQPSRGLLSRSSRFAIRKRE